MVFDEVHFLACLILAMLIVRAIQSKLSKDSDTGKALAWLFH